MARNLNYEKDPYKHAADRNYRDKCKYVNARNVPTIIQKQYYEFLHKKCNENGIPMGIHPNASRGEYSKAINRMCWRLKEKGISYKWDSPKFSFQDERPKQKPDK